VLSQKNIEQQQRDTAATRKLEARAQLDRVLARIAVPLSLSLSSLSSLSLLSLLSLSPLSPLSLSSLSHTSLSLI
jgi:hypothetical protein